MNNYFALPKLQQRQIIEQATLRIKLPVQAIEKDIWVSTILQIIFSLPVAQRNISESARLQFLAVIVQGGDRDVVSGLSVGYNGIDIEYSRRAGITDIADAIKLMGATRRYVPAVEDTIDRESERLASRWDVVSNIQPEVRHDARHQTTERRGGCRRERGHIEHRVRHLIISKRNNAIGKCSTVRFMSHSIEGVRLRFIQRYGDASEIGITGGLMDSRHFGSALIQPHVQMCHKTRNARCGPTPRSLHRRLFIRTERQTNLGLVSCGHIAAVG